MAVVTLAELLEAGVHFGHQARRWNPKMFPYIYAERNGIHIIDLVQTSQLLTNACDYARKASEEGKKFLFVGTKRQAASVISQEAERCGAAYVNQRWLGGILTNWFTIRTRVERLRDLEQQEENGYLDQLPKKDLVIVVDQKRESTAVQECIKLKIPVISILDTNCDPDLTDIPIPANDDAIRSIKLIVSKLADSIYEGSMGTRMNHDDSSHED